MWQQDLHCCPISVLRRNGHQTIQQSYESSHKLHCSGLFPERLSTRKVVGSLNDFLWHLLYIEGTVSDEHCFDNVQKD